MHQNNRNFSLGLSSTCMSNSDVILFSYLIRLLLGGAGKGSRSSNLLVYQSSSAYRWKLELHELCSAQTRLWNTSMSLTHTKSRTKLVLNWKIANETLPTYCLSQQFSYSIVSVLSCMKAEVPGLRTVWAELTKGTGSYVLNKSNIMAHFTPIHRVTCHAQVARQFLHSHTVQTSLRSPQCAPETMQTCQFLFYFTKRVIECWMGE